MRQVAANPSDKHIKLAGAVARKRIPLFSRGIDHYDARRLFQQRAYFLQVVVLLQLDINRLAMPLHDRQANVSLSSDKAWVSLSGEAAFVQDRAKLEEVWSAPLEAWFPGGVDDPTVGLLKFSADGAEFWHSPGGVIVRAVALLRGKPSAGSENATVDL